MFKISDIKENNDYIIFFKIIEKKFLENLIKDGQVYFTPLSTYREMEKEKGKTSIGDKNEGLLTKKIQEYIKYDGEYYQVHGSDAGYHATINANQCAFCCYAVGLKNFTFDGLQNCYHRIPYSTIEKVCKDKGGVDNCVILAFDIDVINRICDALYEKISFRRGMVIYDDFDYIPENDINSIEYALECCFHKGSNYQYQNEFRIAAINNTNREIDNLYISVEEKDFDIIELKDNCDFYCSVNIDSGRIDDINGKEQQMVCFSFSFY